MPKRKRPYEANPTVVEVPVACPRCGGINRTVTKTHRFPHRPLRIGDKTWPGRTIRRCRCTDCGRAFNVSSPLPE
ncbi:hypothetical protein ES703_118353 [subsurface metagenome]